MSSCSSEIPIPLQTGGICSGHGICINSSISNLLLCKCDFLYNGANDFFDTRVELLPNGEYLALSCNNSVIGIYITWGIWIALGIIRIIILIPIWLYYYKRHYVNAEFYTKFIFYDVPFRIVTMDLFILTSLYLITGLTKMMGMTFGTDILTTILLSLTLAVYQIICYDMTKMEFDIFLQSTTGFEQAKKLKVLRTIMKLSATLLSVITSFILAIVTLSLDKNKGPILNGEEFALYVRNANGIFFTLVEVASSWMILKRIVMIRVINNATNTSITYIIVKMKNEIRSYIVRAFFLCILYGCFNISYFLPYQTYSIAIVGCLGFALPHSKALTTEKERLSKNSCDVTKPSSILNNNSKIRKESIPIPPLTLERTNSVVTRHNNSKDILRECPNEQKDYHNSIIIQPIIIE